MNVRIVFHLYSDVAWTTGEAAGPRKNAAELIVTTHGIVVSEWEMQARAVVEM